jgi:hypothetical protein
METVGNGDREKIESEMRREKMVTGEDRAGGRWKHSTDGDRDNMETGADGDIEKMEILRRWRYWEDGDTEKMEAAGIGRQREYGDRGRWKHGKMEASWRCKRRRYGERGRNGQQERWRWIFGMGKEDRNRKTTFTFSQKLLTKYTEITKIFAKTCQQQVKKEPLLWIYFDDDIRPKISGITEIFREDKFSRNFVKILEFSRIFVSSLK